MREREHGEERCEGRQLQERERGIANGRQRGIVRAIVKS